MTEYVAQILRSSTAGRTLSALSVAAGVLLLLGVAGCASGVSKNPSRPSSLPTASFDQPLRVVHDAAIDSLKEMRCDVTGDEAQQIQAHFATGEIVTITMFGTAEQRTDVWISTQITYVGAAWQKDRGSDIQWGIRRSLRNSK